MQHGRHRLKRGVFRTGIETLYARGFVLRNKLLFVAALFIVGCDVEEPEDPTLMEVQAAVCVELAKE